MNLANAFSRIDVVAHTESAVWWQIVAALTPLATLVVFVFVVAAFLRADRRQPHEAEPEMPADSWSRAEWAIDMALDDRPERWSIGLAVLDQLSSDHSVGKEDARIVAQARALLNRRLADHET